MSETNNPGCLGWLFGLLGLGETATGETATGETADAARADADPFPFRLSDNFLSPSERSFYGVLVSVVGARAVICPKVRVADLVHVARSEDRQAHQNRISQKHVDFVLCAPDTMKPLLALELDDKSHARQDRVARDEIVDNVFRAAGLPLLHVPNRSGYVPAELSALLAPHLPGIAPGVTRAVPAATLPDLVDETAEDAAPTCLKCGVTMVARTAARGERQGQSFFGCPNYPRCRETRPLA